MRIKEIGVVQGGCRWQNSPQAGGSGAIYQTVAQQTHLRAQHRLQPVLPAGWAPPKPAWPASPGEQSCPYSQPLEPMLGAALPKEYTGAQADAQGRGRYTLLFRPQGPKPAPHPLQEMWSRCEENVGLPTGSLPQASPQGGSSGRPLLPLGQLGPPCSFTLPHWCPGAAACPVLRFGVSTKALGVRVILGHSWVALWRPNPL